MEKRLVLSLLCALHIGLIKPAIALPTNTSVSQSDFIEKTKLLEEKKAALISKMQQNDQVIRSHNDAVRSCNGDGGAAAIILLPLMIATMMETNKINALHKEQIKNKLELAAVEESLEAAYFEELDPVWKKKLLISKNETFTAEFKKLSSEMPVLEKASQKKPFYFKLCLLNAAALVGAGVLAGKTNSNKNLKHLHNLSKGMLAAFFFSIIFPLSKLFIALDDHRDLEVIKKKLLELEMKKSDLVHKMNETDSSFTTKKPTLETLAVVPSNELFKEIYDAAHFEKLDTESKKKKLLSKIEATTTESNKLTNEASSLEKKVAKKSLYWKYFGASLFYFFSAGYLKTTPGSFSENALLAHMLFSTIPAFASLFKLIDAEEAGKSLEEIKRKLIELKEKTAQHSVDLANVTAN